MTESGSFYKDMQRDHEKGYQRYLKQRYDALNMLVKINEDDKILDAGCGDGVVLGLLLNKKVKNIEIFAIDNSEKILNIAKNNFSDRPEIKFSIADIRDLHFPDNFFSKIICFHVIEHLEEEDLLRSLKELRRVNKGELFLGLPNKYSALRITEILSSEGITGFLSRVGCFLDQEKPLVVDKPSYVDIKHIYYNVGYIKKALVKAGFSVQSIKKVYFPIKLLDISKNNLSVPFGHSIIIKAT